MTTTPRRGHATRKIAALALSAACSLLFAPTLASAKAKAGAKAPTLQGQVIGGAATSLGALRGKVVLVDFWATWCAPCRASLPKYEALQRAYGGKGLVILAVSVDEEAPNVARFVKKHHLSLRVIHDKGGKIAERYAPPKMPTAYLIGRDGAIRWVHAGFKKGDGAAVEAQIKAALAAGGTAPGGAGAKPSAPAKKK